MKAEGKEFHDIKQQDEVLKEATQCKADARRRLDAAVEDLEDFLNGDGKALTDSEEYKEALSLVDSKP